MARVVIAREHDETAAVKPPRQRRRTEADWERMADQYLATGFEGLTAEPAVQFRAYDNHHRDRARVHRGDCSHCNNGQVTQGASGDNDTWRGPFGSPAQAYAKVAGRADVTYCSFCLPDGG